MPSTACGNSNATAVSRGEQAPASTSTVAGSSAELSFWMPSGSAAGAPRDQGGCPRDRGDARRACVAAAPRLQEPEHLLGEQERNKEQKRGEQTCGRPRLLVIGLQL